MINVRDFGAIGNSVTDDTKAIQAALDSAAMSFGGETVFFHDGIYKVSAPLVVFGTSISLIGTSRESVQLQRRSDYGPTIVFGNSATLRNGYQLKNIWFVDANASMTVANSPNHIIFEHCARVLISDCLISEGGGLLLSGAANVQINNLFMCYTTGEATGRHGIRVKYSTISGASYPLGGDIHCRGVHLTCGNKIDDGILLQACDGFYWEAGCHIINTLQSNIHIKKDGTRQLSNIEVTGGLLDITQGHGVWGDGSTGSGAVDTLRIDCPVSSAGLGGAGKHGIYFGTGFGATNVSIRGHLAGFRGDGIRCESQYVSDMVINCRMKNITGNGIYIVSGARITIDSPHIGGDGTFTNGIRVGALANGVAIHGGMISDTSGWGIQIDNGAVNTSVVGVRLKNNPSGAINNLSVAGTYYVNSNSTI